MSNTKKIKVGNITYVKVLFILPIILDRYGKRLKIFSSASEIHENTGFDHKEYKAVY